MSNSWEIWAEGFAATGESGSASRLGFGTGETFSEAVEGLVKILPEKEAALFNKREDGSWDYWGCRLFPDQASASKSFG